MNDSASKILLQCADLLKKKGQDYNNSVKREDYFLYGRKSYMTMIHIKYLRLKSLLEQDNPNFESLEDTLKDLINYAAIWCADEENK
jgi:hypothetical protein